MAGRHFQLSTGSLFLTWLIAAIVILLLKPSITDRAILVFHGIFRPVLDLERQVQTGVTNDTNAEGSVQQQEYDRLKKEFSNLHAQLLELHEEYEKATQMRSGLPTPFSELVIARVTGAGDPLSHEIIINKGTDSGIIVGNYVLSAGKNSIVGIVEETGEQLSRVLLLTDARQKIPVVIQRPGQTADSFGGLMIGSGKTNCTIANITTEKTVKVGDMVFARPHPGLLNVPVVIGEVTRVRADDKHPLLWDITVRPVEDLKHLDDVAVIVVEDF